MALPLLLAVSMTASASSQVSVSIVDGEIVLTPDPLPVGDGHDVLLTWRITTPGWTFAEDGIEIADASDEFSDPELSADKRVFTEIDKDDNGLSYKYSVTVTDGGEPISKDPAIQNGGH
jgi:hypothetical protein